MKFKASDGWDRPMAAARNKRKSILVWIDNGDGTFSQWKVLPDGRRFFVREVVKG